jgi:hypothetical protein
MPAAVACAPLNIDRVQAAIHSASGCSFPLSMTCVARRTLSAISEDEIGEPAAAWYSRHHPIAAAAGV